MWLRCKRSPDKDSGKGGGEDDDNKAKRNRLEHIMCHTIVSHNSNAWIFLVSHNVRGRALKASQSASQNRLRPVKLIWSCAR